MSWADIVVDDFVSLSFCWLTNVVGLTAYEWVSSFLTALQHKIGYIVPYRKSDLQHMLIEWIVSGLLCADVLLTSRWSLIH